MALDGLGGELGVTNFPDVGNYVQDSTDTSGYASDNQGTAWVTFDESTGTSGSATRTVYVGVADKDNAVYRSTDGGATWSRLAGQPTGYLAHKGVLDATNGYLYLAYSDKGGPYDGDKGQLWRYATKTGTWTDISPVAEADTYYGFSGLTVDRQHPGTVMATAYSSWWPDTQISGPRTAAAPGRRPGTTPRIPTARTATQWTSRPCPGLPSAQTRRRPSSRPNSGG